MFNFQRGSMTNTFRRYLFGAATLASVSALASAQSIDDLNLQFHGYATQAYLKTTQNNFLTTDSSAGSAAWTETVVNLTASPSSRLRVAIQGRYSLIGTNSNAITLDYATADYKVNERVGIRFGKVKVPNALFNETQDIDPSYIWSLLPQSVYPLLSRNSSLSIFGGAAYGSVPIGEKFGRLDYRAFGGVTELPSNDGYLTLLQAENLTLPNGFTVSDFGAMLRWKTPLKGLLIGVSDKRYSEATNSVLLGGSLSGSYAVQPFNSPDYFAQYERGRFMFAGEYARIHPRLSFSFPQGPTFSVPVDTRGWYGMATYKITNKLSAGLYVSQLFNRNTSLGPARFSKDWALSARYDFNQYLYAKAEQHFIDGTAVGYSGADNPSGLKPDTSLTLLKLGVSF
jgi:hypothetical protein